MTKSSNKNTNQANLREKFRVKLANYRKRTGLSQAALAAAVGLSHSRFSERLNGHTNPNVLLFTIPEITAILDYLDSHNAFYTDSERTDLLLTARACDYWQEQPQILSTTITTAAETVGVVDIASSSIGSHDQLVLTTTLTTTVTITTTPNASNLELAQPSQLQPQVPALTRKLFAAQEPLAHRTGTIQVNLGSARNEQTIASELARLLLEQLMQALAKSVAENSFHN